MQIRRRRFLLLTFWVTLVFLPPLIVALKFTGIATGPNFYDFGAYYNAAERAVYGYPLYDVSTPYSRVTEIPKGTDAYLYPPIIVLLFIPFLLFEPSVAAVVWTIFSTLVYILGILLFVDSFELDFKKRHWLAIVSGAIGFSPFVTTIIPGQVSGILAGLLSLSAASVVSYDRRPRGLLVGLFTTLPVVIKPFYAPVGAVLLRDCRRIGWAVAVGVVALMAGGILFGVDSTIDYLYILRQGKGWGADPNPINEWNISAFYPLYLFGSFKVAIQGLLFASVSAVAILSRRISSEYVDMYVFSLGIVAFALGSPTVATHALTALAPVILFLIITTYGRDDRTFSVVIVAAFLIHCHSYAIEFMVRYGPEIVGSRGLVYPLIPIIQPAVWGTVLLAALVSYELYVEAGRPPGFSP